MKRLKLDKKAFDESLLDSSLFSKVISRDETRKVLGGLGVPGKTIANSDRATTSHSCDPCGIDIMADGKSSVCQAC